MTSNPSLHPHLSRLAAVAGAAAIGAGCGAAAEPEDERAAPGGSEPAPIETRSAPTATAAEQPPETASSASRAKPEGAPSAGGAGCVFHAPEGRLGEDEITVELDGTSCEQALRLVETAAVGQPTGANLSLSRDGFDCEPSTTDKGADVTYSCANGAERAGFQIVWSSSSP